MLHRILALARKEFLNLFKDRHSRTVIILPPIIQLLIFGYAATFDLTRIPFAVFNQDKGAASRELVAKFKGSPNFHLVRELQNTREIKPLINKKEALLVVHIRDDFNRDLLRGKTASVQILIDGRNSNTALLALGYVRSIVSTFNSRWIDDHGRRGPPAELNVRAWFNPNLESRWFIIPGIVGLLTLVVTMLVTAMTVAREREQGTFDQLLVTPLRPFEILMGKALPGMVIGMGEASIIIFLAVFWFNVPLIGSLPNLYFGIFLFLLSAVGVGLMISSLCVTQQQALLGAFMFMVPSVILSGFTTPIANMPKAVQLITLLNPLRYFMVILRGVFLQDLSFPVLLPQYWPMALIGLGTLILAGYLFRHRMY